MKSPPFREADLFSFTVNDSNAFAQYVTDESHPCQYAGSAPTSSQCLEVIWQPIFFGFMVLESPAGGRTAVGYCTLQMIITKPVESCKLSLLLVACSTPCKMWHLLVQDEVQIERPITRPLLLSVLSLAQEG